MDYYEARRQSARESRGSAATVAAMPWRRLDLTPWRTGHPRRLLDGREHARGQALVHRLARHGRRAISIDASELISLGAPADVADSFVFVSEGGRSRETIEAALSITPGARLGCDQCSCRADFRGG